MFFYKRITLIGLGFKAFSYKNYLWLYIGLSHYILFKIPITIKIFCCKKKIYVCSLNKKDITNFIRQMKYYNIFSKYKGKGLLEFKQFKGFIILKKGKKQQ